MTEWEAEIIVLRNFLSRNPREAGDLSEARHGQQRKATIAPTKKQTEVNFQEENGVRVQNSA